MERVSGCIPSSSSLLSDGFESAMGCEVMVQVGCVFRSQKNIIKTDVLLGIPPRSEGIKSDVNKSVLL